MANQPIRAQFPFSLPAGTDGRIIQKKLIDVGEVPPSDVVRITGLVLFTDAADYKPLLRVVEGYREQTHQNKHLILLNTTEFKLVADDVLDITEIRVDPQPRGQLLNLGLSRADDGFVTVLSTDAWSHRQRFAYQASFCRAKTIPTKLVSQVRCALRHSIIFLHSNPHGLDSTLMFPKSLGRFTDDDNGYFRGKHGDKARLIPNMCFPYNCMQVEFHHGRNPTPLHDFLRRLTPPEKFVGVCMLGKDETEYLKAVLERYGMKTEAPAQPAKTP